MSSNLIIRHWIATTPEEVWRAYTTPEIFHQFFSPEGLSIPLESVVIEPWAGGRFECTMVFDDTGVEYPNIGVLTVVEPPHTLVGEEPSIGFRSTQTFMAEGDGTLITVVQEGLPAEIIGNPEVIAAFRSSYRKLGRVLGVVTEERDCA
ncbi:MAG: SRPBCC domain-containing protein [Acidobacteria bacterium]|nr:SRPBCC domain-containing protein [Acidobacteriota bacterium]